jgi:hypothetical protein
MAGMAEPEEGMFPSLNLLQQRTAQCLVRGQYAAKAHTLEAFLLHLQSCYFNNEGLAIDPWFEMGSVIRLAFRMGYHRDPSNLDGISPFDGEMRRRVWLNIFQLDALISFEMGLPSMIPTDFCDTAVPRNLEYSDLYVDMTALPPSRPFSEHTPVLYIIAKASVMAVFKKIVAHTQALSTPTYDNTVALGTEMNQVYNMLPEQLKRRDVNRSFIDTSNLIWQRCTIEILYLKGLIVLHRRYISYELQSPKYEALRLACIEAALNILARQDDLQKACAPGGRLYEDRWMIFMLPKHDFLMAAMVVCLDLSVRMRSQRGVLVEGEGGDGQQLAGREHRALQNSQRIWAVHSAVSPEAHIAELAVDLMIKKVAENDVGIFLTDENPPEQPSVDVDSELPYADAMAQMIDGSGAIDWVSFFFFFFFLNKKKYRLH